MKSFFSQFIPDSIKENALKHSYAKNLVRSAFIASIATPSYALLYYYLHFYQASFIILLVGFIITSAIFLLRLPGSLILARELILLSSFLCLTWLSYRMGGLNAPTSFWLIMPPLLAIFFGSILEGLLWSFICFVTIVIFFLLAYLQIPLPASPVTKPLLLYTASLGGLIVIIFCLVYFFEIGKREAAQEILSVNKKIQLAKDKAENLAKKAEIANRLKTEFLANMSHELRTPLNGIIGFTELICSGKTGPISNEQNEYLHDVLISAQHLLQLINDILDLTKVEAGKMTFSPEPVNLFQLSDEVTESLSALIKEKHIQFTVEIDPVLKHMVIDPLKLKQIIYNYLSNAIKFTPENGKIRLRAYPFGVGHFKIEVIDNGIGIRDADLKKLFVEFQQLDSSLSKKYQGTGLGLALTQHIVEAQRGYVGVESQFGKGSNFYAILPWES